jgi:hypothetical protein
MTGGADPTPADPDAMHSAPTDEQADAIAGTAKWKPGCRLGDRERRSVDKVGRLRKA